VALFWVKGVLSSPAHVGGTYIQVFYITGRPGCLMLVRFISSLSFKGNVEENIVY